MEVSEPSLEKVPAEGSSKKVSFAPDTKLVTPGSSRPSTAPPPDTAKKEEPVDGVIGQLEVYKSGAVKIRLTNGTLLDVSRHDLSGRVDREAN
jgi:DNA-directed RNA polymerase III subunit RPC4